MGIVLATILLGTPLPYEANGQYRWEPDFGRMNLVEVRTGEAVGFVYRDRRFYLWVRPLPLPEYQFWGTALSTPLIQLPRKYTILSLHPQKKTEDLEWGAGSDYKGP